MTTYRTGNPVGSSDPRDLYDNAENLDNFVNGEQPSYDDRLGESRKSWAGMENRFAAAQSQREVVFDAAQSSREAVFSDFLQASGYQDLGEYAPGIEITAHNQYVTFGGQPYLLKPSIPVPYTTSGEWTGDDFKLIGDGSLRQDLANPGIGAAMVARGVVAVDSIVDLLSLPEGQRKEGLRYLVKGYHAGSDVGGGEFYWDETKLKSEHDGGYVIDPNKTFPSDWTEETPTLTAWFVSPGAVGGGCFLRSPSSEVMPTEYGGGLGDVDSTEALRAVIRRVALFGRHSPEVFLPSGVYNISSQIDIPAQTTVRGQIGLRSNIVWRGSAGKALQYENNCRLEDLYITNDNPASLASCIEMKTGGAIEGKQSKFVRLYIWGFVRGIVADGWSIVVDDCIINCNNLAESRCIDFVGTNFNCRVTGGTFTRATAGVHINNDSGAEAEGVGIFISGVDISLVHRGVDIHAQDRIFITGNYGEEMNLSVIHTRPTFNGSVFIRENDFRNYLGPASTSSTRFLNHERGFAVVEGNRAGGYNPETDGGMRRFIQASGNGKLFVGHNVASCYEPVKVTLPLSAPSVIDSPTTMDISFTVDIGADEFPYRHEELFLNTLGVGGEESQYVFQSIHVYAVTAIEGSLGDMYVTSAGAATSLAGLAAAGSKVEVDLSTSTLNSNVNLNNEDHVVSFVLYKGDATSGRLLVKAKVAVIKWFNDAPQAT